MAKNLTQLVQSKKITKPGSDWLRTALDPFYDYAEDFEGFPDVVSGKSKVQLLTSTLSVSSPDGNPYSARVWLNPTYGVAGRVFNGITATNDQHVDVAAGVSFGANNLLVAEAWNAGNPNTTVPGANLVRTSSGTSPTNTPSRLVAVGFEIHNTTPVLNQSGVITCSRRNNHIRNENRQVWDSTSATPAIPTIQTVRVVNLPPITPTDALLVAGATQWHASKGAYMVAHLAQPDMPVKWNESAFVQFDSGLTCQCAETTVVGAAGLIYPSTDNTTHAFDLPYAILTDLSAESTFTVTLRAFFEYFPIDSTLIRMATPSPPFDYKALALYGAVAPRLPMAVPVAMNAKGDYFRMVMSAIASAISILSPAAAAIHPSGPMVAQIAAQVAKVLSQKPSSNNKAGRPRPPLPKKKARKAPSGWGSLGGMPVS